MAAYIVMVVVGIVLIVLGIFNMRGNISSLHSYHRARVKEEDRLPFGKRVGLGNIICGGAAVVSGVLSALAVHFSVNLLIYIGTAVLIVGLVIGLTIACAAMIKYNKGIF